MKTRLHYSWIILFLAIMACNMTAPSPTPAQQQSSPLPPVPTTLNPTSATIPTASTNPTSNANTTAGPQCTVLQDLNLRFGPGTAYRPPIRALPVNSVVTPLGFVPQGIPGGSWAYVQDLATQDKGWVSAGSQYISCNVELATLPSVAFGTPPPPVLPRSAQSSDPDGNGFCVDPLSELKCVGIFSEEALFQFQIMRNGTELGENDGVDQVAFTVKKDGVPVYNKVENNAAYCIFGGDGPCNSWVLEDGVYKWTQGGTPVEPGEYKVEVDTTVDGEDAHWEVFFKLTLP